MDKSAIDLYFGLFNEIGIIEQLARAAFEKRLPNGVNLSHFGVVNHLVRVRDGQTPLALAKAFQVPKTTMTHTLGGLERWGYIELRANPRDGRSKCAWLTERGRTFRDDAIVSLVPDLKKLAEAFPQDRIERLVPVLSEIRAYMDDARNE